MTTPGADIAAATTAARSAVESAVVPAVLAAAVEDARAAAVEAGGPDGVGDYLGVDYEDPTAATHRFEARLAGYRGWQWAVVMAAYSTADHATVSEVVLIPGPAALLAPEWVPWEQRVRPGDLGPGDLLAPAVDDSRLVPGYTASGDPQVDETAGEIGLGRRWVMSAEGRSEAAERWRNSDYGPDSAMARSTKRVCRDCGFFLPLAGSLGTMFGVCGNALSADGHVVYAEYGCGAHTDTPQPAAIGSPAHQPYDDSVLDVQADEPAATGDAAQETPGEAVEIVEAVDPVSPETGGDPEATDADTAAEVDAVVDAGADTDVSTGAGSDAG